MKESIIKSAFAVAAAGLTAYFRVLLIPIVMLAVVMLVDYLTGLTYAIMTNTVSSKIGRDGIIKKVFSLLAVGVGMVMDWIVMTGLSQVGINIKGMFLFGMLVCIWLIINELISILENISKSGVPLPAFLMKAVSTLKTTVEKAGEENIKGDDNENRT